MVGYITEMKFSAFFLLACGAVVKEKEALTGLEAVVKKYNFLNLTFSILINLHSLKFTDAFAFGAERLISHQPAVWMVSYADQVLVSGQPCTDSIANLLYSSGVGKHTSIVYINRSSGGAAVVTKQYIWEHQSQRPHTFSFPIACPLCLHVYSWQSIPSQRAAEEKSFIINCKTKLRGGKKCKGTWEVPMRPNSSVVASPNMGVWRVF